MRLKTGTAASLSGNLPLLVVLVPSGRLKDLPGGELGARAAALSGGKAFEGKRGQTLLLHAESRGGPRALLLIGLGKKGEVDGQACREAGLTAGAEAARLEATRFAVTSGGKFALDADTLFALGEGCVLSSYRYKVKTPDTKPAREVSIVSGVSGAAAVLRRAQAVGEGANLARELGDLPGNICTPRHLKSTAASIARKGKLRFKAHDKAALKRLKYGGILAVNQGSTEPPFLLELDYKPASYKKTICIVGKGLTFDSGGISIKPGGGMEEMKYDMCGAAATLGLMQAVAASKPKGVRVIGIVGTTDNMPSGSAYKPGDVVTTGSGKTIEVINTDAEGRVVLADALYHATKYKPDAIIDMATLTGAIVVALGHEAAGLFSTDDGLTKRLVAASERSGEQVWPMPTYDAYKEAVKSRWADVRNSAGRAAGSCTAAAFLFNFTEGCAHAHLDVAGAAWEMKASHGMPPGARGFGVRLLHDALSHWTR